MEKVCLKPQGVFAATRNEHMDLRYRSTVVDLEEKLAKLNDFSEQKVL